MHARPLYRISLILVAFAMLVQSRSSWGDANSDFAQRCAAQGVFFCIGFDSQQATNAIGQTRYAQGEGPIIIPNPQAYPNNLSPGGLRYPAVDTGQAASGAGSLRITANPVASNDQSGGWYLGSAGISSWPQKFGAGETLYVQWRQRYDFAFTNTNWSQTAGGDGNKSIVFWRNESSCSDMELTIQDNFSRGFPQAYTNCGGRPLYLCPASGGDPSVCFPYNTNYAPLPHASFVYQWGPRQPGDFACVRDAETDSTCAFYRDHHDRWWTYYVQVDVGAPNVAATRVRMWVSRGGGEPLRQFIDYGPFPWAYASSSYELENLMLTLYHTGKRLATHPAAHTWYDEMILSSQPISPPAELGGMNCGGSSGAAPCPPSALSAR